MDIDTTYAIGKAVIDRDVLLQQYSTVIALERTILTALVYSLIDAFIKNARVTSRLSSEQVELMRRVKPDPMFGDPCALLSLEWFLQAWDDEDAIGVTGFPYAYGPATDLRFLRMEDGSLVKVDKLPSDLTSKLIEMIGPEQTPVTYRKYMRIKGLFDDAKRKIVTDIGKLTMDIRETM